jgi:hypothetical protein
VELTISERAGIARTGEPITIGVPLPENLITDTAVLALTDAAGNKIDCEFRKAAEWLNNSSIRWVHLDFQASLAESASTKVVLHEDATKHLPGVSKLTITDLGTKYEVNTGMIKFTVKKANYNVFDEVYVDASGNGNYSANQVVKSHTRGLAAIASESKLLYRNVTFTSSNDDSSTTVVERHGPMAVVLKSMGHLRDSTGRAALRFISRIYAYNNSKYVKLVYTFENSIHDHTWFLIVQSLEVDIPTTLSSNPQFILGAPGQDKTGNLPDAGSEAYCLACNPNDIGKTGQTAVNYYYGGAVTDTGEAISTKPTEMGWAALKDNSKGMAFAIRDFWQTNPTSVEVFGDGLCRISLYPRRRNGQYIDVWIHGGIARTHEMRFVFLGNEDGPAIKAQAAGMQKPLMAFAPTSWYCFQTYASGKFLDRYYDNYRDDYQVWIKSADTRLDAIFNAQRILIDRRTVQSVTLDAYGILDWGDGFHWAWDQQYQPRSVSWDGQYYGLPHVYFAEFIRSGNECWFDAFEAHARSLMDVQIGHFGPADTNTGACRYCPAREHMKRDDGTPYISGECNHHKNQALFERYYLCGDERSLDIALESSNWAISHYPDVYQNVGQIRGPAFFCLMLLPCYQYTKDSQYLTPVANTVNYHVDHLNSNNKNFSVFSQFDWMGSFFLEAVIDYCELSPSDKIKTYIKDASSYASSITDTRWVLTHTYSHHLTGDTLYLDRAVESIKRMPSSYNNIYKDFASHNRSLSRGLYYFRTDTLSILAEDNDIVLEPLTLVVNPNPFNPSTTITIDCRVKIEDLKLKIYDINGKMVNDFTSKIKNQQSSILNQITWNARQHPSGIYIIKALADGKTCVKAITLIK